MESGTLLNGLIKELDVRTCMAFQKLRGVQQVGVYSVEHSFVYFEECAKAREKNILSLSLSFDDPLYKWIKSKAFAKCFKDIRIVQLWYF